MAEIFEADVVVIGAGVVGLACARAAALENRNVLVLEKNDHIGMEISSHNSEVIHAGIYYPRGSLKARLCVEGKRMLYQFCRERSIAHRQLGKLVVAAEYDQTPVLSMRKAIAEECGVYDLKIVDKVELAELEPEVYGFQALLSPSTGIVDSHALMLGLQADIESNNGHVVCRAPVIDCKLTQKAPELLIGGDEPMVLRPNLVVNAAGLNAVELARMFVGSGDATLPRAYYAKGHYYALSGRSPFSRLIYPIPQPGGLGIHVTLDMSGQARFGPNVQWQNEPDYAFDPACFSEFVTAISAYYPGLDADRLVPGYTGIRPKIAAPHEEPADFRIDAENSHGVPGLINLLGIESPGLTSSLAIGKKVATLIASLR